MLNRLARGAFVTLQYTLPQHWITRATARLANVRTPWLKNLLIRAFVRLADVDLNEAAEPRIARHPTLAAFFARTLHADARPLAAAPAWLVPCDGVVSAAGPLSDDTLVQAKGFHYSATDLLGDADAAAAFRGGHYVTIYLAPGDYHRVHSPLTATVSRHVHIPGQLFAVNQATAHSVPRLYTRNERRVFGFGPGGSDSALVMVGAINVGSISTQWDDHHPAGTFATITPLPTPATRLHRGDTLGWFNLGSTVIVLLPAHASLAPNLRAGTAVRMGQPLATPDSQ